MGRYPTRLGLVATALVAVLLMLVAWLGTPSSVPPSTRTPEPASIDDKIGVYGLGDRDLVRAQRAGVELMVRRGNPTEQTKKHNVSVVNGRVATILYEVACPGGPGRCLPASQNRLALLERWIDQHLDSQPTDIPPAGFLVTDDMWGDLSGYLPTLANTLRSNYPKVPLLCSFYLEIPDRGESPDDSLRRFQNSLVNYSPDWCDRVVVYAYGRTRDAPGNHQPDWGMTSVLEPALDSLTSAGWPPKQAWTGVVQGFGFTPRTRASTRQLQHPEWVQPPRPHELRSQAESFCNDGAESIWIYTWEEDSVGQITDVRSRPEYLDAVASGVSGC